MSNTDDRQVKRRLAILRHAEEVTGNVAMTCRYYGITRQSFYIWKRRYDELGPEGLVDRSRRPKVSPNVTSAEVVGKILYLRQHYHFGPAKISMYLKRYHDVTISHSGVWRILKRLDLNRLPASQRYKRLDKRWQRYEKQLPGHQVQIDVKFIAPIKGVERRKYYQFTAIDDCTRLRVLRIYPAINQKTAIQFADYVLERLPFVVQVIQTDNGSEFGSSFHYHLLDKGVGHVYIKPRTPRLNGKVERSHRIDAEEFYRLLEGAVIDDAKVFNNKLQEWEDYYNYHRPHGGLGGQTPYERLRQKTQAPTAKTQARRVTRQRQLHTAATTAAVGLNRHERPRTTLNNGVPLRRLQNASAESGVGSHRYSDRGVSPCLCPAALQHRLLLHHGCSNADARHFSRGAVFWRDIDRLGEEKRQVIVRDRDGYERYLRKILKTGQEAGVVDPEMDLRTGTFAVLGLVNSHHRWFRPGGPVTARQLGREFTAFVLAAVALPPARDSSRYTLTDEVIRTLTSGTR